MSRHTKMIIQVRDQRNAINQCIVICFVIANFKLLFMFIECLLKDHIHLLWLYRNVSCIGLMCKSQHRLLKRLQRNDPSQTEAGHGPGCPFYNGL